jgi:hypothetical protein
MFNQFMRVETRSSRQLLLKLKNVLVLDKRKDVLVNVRKDAVGLVKDYPHSINVLIDWSESEVFVLFRTHLLSGRQSSDLPVYE